MKVNRYRGRRIVRSVVGFSFHHCWNKNCPFGGMTVPSFICSGILLLLVLTTAGQTTLKPEWDNGLKFKSADGATSIGIGGRLHYDVAFINHSQELDSLAGPAADKLEVRRARLSFEGIIKNAVKYEFEFTFGESIKYADLYVAFLKLPFVEQLTVGHFREPFGMEENTSSNSIVFMERSLPSSFAPGRNAGMMVQKTFLANRMRVYGGVFRITNSLGSDTAAEGKHSLTGRLAYLPLWDSARNKTLHVGLASNIYTPINRTYVLNVENATHTGDSYIKSGVIDDVQHVQNVGGEAGFTHKRFAVQSEYMHSFVRINKMIATEIIDRVREFNSFYVTTSYFLGGGRRKYDKERNSFSAVALSGDKRNAWELALRYSQIHLRESTENIKRLNDITMGVNWYYSSTWRVMFNYIHSRIQNRYYANAVQMRLQATF